MSNAQIFIVGFVITLLVAIALVPLLWAAVLDGRDEQAARRSAGDRGPETPRAEAGRT